MRLLAIVPARGGSKGIKNKNIYKINNKPLIQYTLEQIKGIREINKIIVSSDSKKIISFVKKFKYVESVVRPKFLAQDKSLVIDTLRHHVNFEKKNNRYYDYVLILSPTSPLRKKKHIIKSIKIVKRKKPDSLISVISLEKPLNWLLGVTKKGYLKEYLGSGSAFIRRQDAKKYFFPNGAIYILKVNKLSRNGYYFKRSIPFFMDYKSSIDIDSIKDVKEMLSFKKKV